MPTFWDLMHVSVADRRGPKPPEIETQLLYVTPEQAAYWLANTHYQHQRQVRDHHVERLRRAILTDTFETSEINFYDYGAGPRCVNGWHRLHAIVAAEKGVWLTVSLHREVTEEETRDAYRRYDVGMIRGLYEILNSAEIGEELDISTQFALRLNSAASLIYYRFDVRYLLHARTNFRDYEAVIERLRDWASEGRAYQKALKCATGANRRNLATRSVMAVALATYRHQPERAPEFWEEVAENSGLIRAQPQHTLVNYLAEVNHHWHHVNQIMRGVATVWNAFYENREISVVRVINPDQPIRIEGTPFGGRDPQPAEVPYALAPPIPNSYLKAA